MYEMLLTYDDVIDPEVLDDVMTLLSDTNWSVVTLDTVIKYPLIVKLIQYVQYVTRYDAVALFQGERPCYSTASQESAL